MILQYFSKCLKAFWLPKVASLTNIIVKLNLINIRRFKWKILQIMVSVGRNIRLDIHRYFFKIYAKFCQDMFKDMRCRYFLLKGVFKRSGCLVLVVWFRYQGCWINFARAMWQNIWILPMFAETEDTKLRIPLPCSSIFRCSKNVSLPICVISTII